MTVIITIQPFSRLLVMDTDFEWRLWRGAHGPGTKIRCIHDLYIVDLYHVNNIF